jgi:para-nitrobenzyl esterase
MALETDRRALVAGALALPLVATPALAAPSFHPASDRIETGPASRVETSHGLVQGYRDAGVHVFKGIPYAGSPDGAGRFARAPALKAWSGVRNALNYGPICPQLDRQGDLSGLEWPFLLPRGQATAILEDCLRINIWTRGLKGGRRPVMLWLHGQGFMGGSSQDFLATDGANLARTQDVVVASINHRVGPLGFMHLADLGQAPAEGGMAGMLDIVDALTWLKANAEGFGGDPGNITVFGESGGGFKTSVLLAMPEAEGLFHKAIIQSGARLRVQDRDGATALARETLMALGLSAGDPLKLRDVPAQALLQAADTAYRKIAAAEGKPASFYHPPRSWWMPVAETPALPAQPWDPDAPALSAHIPLLVGTTLHEASPSMNDPSVESYGWAEVEARLRGPLGDKASDAVAAARTAWPAEDPAGILGVIEGRNFRLSAAELIARRLKAPAAPVYNYVLAWKTNAFDGRPRAFHTSDLVFMFANSDLVPQVSGGGVRGLRMAERMAGAWAAFARTGRPSHQNLPRWAASKPDRLETMVLDDNPELRRNPDAQLLRLLTD